MTHRVLTLAPLVDRDMNEHCGGWAVRPGRSAIKVPYPADLSADVIVKAAPTLHAMVVDSIADPLVERVTVFAHSEGCVVAGKWLEAYAHQFGVASPKLDFLLTGNLARARYGYVARRPKWIPKGYAKSTTPENTAFPIVDIGRRGDLWANFPGVFAIPRLPFCKDHVDYSMVDPDNPQPYFAQVVGNTRYLNVP